MTDLFNTTFTGKCPSCSVTMTATAQETPEVNYALGDIVENMVCGACGSKMTLRVVGLCIAPFEAVKPDEE